MGQCPVGCRCCPYALTKGEKGTATLRDILTSFASQELGWTTGRDGVFAAPLMPVFHGLRDSGPKYFSPTFGHNAAGNADDQSWVCACCR